MEPLLESKTPEDERQGYSEVKLHLANVIKCSVNPGYQNRDFRNRNGTSVIDPDFYHQLQYSVIAASAWQRYGFVYGFVWVMVSMVIFSVWPFVFKRSVVGSDWSPHYIAWCYFLQIVTFFVSSFKGEDRVLRVISLSWYQYTHLAFLLNAYGTQSFINSAPGFAVGYVLVTVILFHILGKYVFFKGTDVRIRYLPQDGPLFLIRGAEVTEVPTNECSHPFREWNDDSGTRQAQRLSIPVDNNASDDDFGDGVFPPVYIHFDVPGHVHMGETSHDASMKVDARSWALLQSTHKEVIQTFSFFVATCLNWLFLNLATVTFAYTVLVSSCCGKIGGPYNFLFFVGGLVMFLIFFLFMIFKDDYRRRTIFYQEVTQRVNQVLQKDVTTADLTLEFHDKSAPVALDCFRFDNPNQRYQFVRGVVVDATTKEIDKSNPDV